MMLDFTLENLQKVTHIHFFAKDGTLAMGCSLPLGTNERINMGNSWPEHFGRSGHDDKALFYHNYDFLVVVGIMELVTGHKFVSTRRDDDFKVYTRDDYLQVCGRVAEAQQPV